MSLWNFIFSERIRSAGMRTKAAHGKVDANVYKVIFFEFKGMQGLTKLCSGKRIDRTSERLLCGYLEKILHGKIFTSIVAT